MADLNAKPVLLHYRGWRGSLQGDGLASTFGFLAVQAALFGVAALVPSGLMRVLLLGVFLVNFLFVSRSRAWPIARVALLMLFRRRLFWGLYALSVTVFLCYFFGQYLMSWAQGLLGESEIRIGGVARVQPKWLLETLRDTLHFNGSPLTFRDFFWFEANTVMIALAFSGAVLIGNDFRYGSLAFYLAKPISTWHYLLGKGLAVVVFLNLFTTLPAVVLWLQFGMLESWEYFMDQSHLLLGILTYGLVLSTSLTIVLLATAAWLRATVPLIMAWMTLFVFAQTVSSALVDGLRFSPLWRLIDLWNCTYVIGNALLHADLSKIRPSPQPEVWQAALVLLGVCSACLSYLIRRVRAVEIVP
jgi:ABC-2 type transport system permease protein